VISAGGATSGLAASIAELARELGAAVVIAGPGAGSGGSEPGRPLLQGSDVLELDATDRADREAFQEALVERWDGVDGAAHVIAPMPPDAAGTSDPGEAMRLATAAFAAGAYSLSAFARTVVPLMRQPSGSTGSIVGVSLWRTDDWLGPIEETLEGVNRYAACELGPRGIRVNLVAAGPLAAPAAERVPAGEALAGESYDKAPLGWDARDPTPIARAACFLLSDWARGVSGDVLHVDGGTHLVGR
jgi:enoyl ACP reductase